nr:hypothetical protein [Tanacetum cinerariifolium]
RSPSTRGRFGQPAGKSKEGTLELEDPQEFLGSILLETFLVLGFLEYTNVTTGLSMLLTIGMGSLEGTIVGVTILVKGHTFTTSVNILPVGFHMWPIDLNNFPVVFQTFLFSGVFIDLDFLLAFTEYIESTTHASWLSESKQPLHEAYFISKFTFVTEFITDEVAFKSTTLSLFKLDLTFLSDPLALETKFTHVDENTGVLESKFVEFGVEGKDRFVEDSSATLEFA